MGVTNSESSAPENYCSVDAECYQKTFKGYQADHECFKKYLPVGFRFKPTDTELISHYLTNKIAGKLLHLNYIQDVNIRDYTPTELTGKYKEYAVDGSEWYFFTTRERKYPNGFRPNRAANNLEGYWKATGKTKPIEDQHGNRQIGSRTSLVYYKWDDKDSRIKGEVRKTNYKMQEYVVVVDAAKSAQDVSESSSNTKPASDQDNKVKAFTDVALCKIYLKPAKSKGNSGPTNDGITPASSDDNNSEEEFIDPFPYFGTGLSSSQENELFERELMEENQTNDYFNNNLPDMDPNHPDFYDFVGQELLTDQQHSLISCKGIHSPVGTPQQSCTSAAAAVHTA